MIFGGFTFASEVLLGEIAGFYGFFIPEAEKQTSLADFVQAAYAESRSWATTSLSRISSSLFKTYKASGSRRSGLSLSLGAGLLS
jgi:hypothetical protein